MKNEIPNVLEIAKNVMPDVTLRVATRLRNIVFSLLGFHESSWNEIELKKDSPLLAEILESEEYKELKARTKQELLGSMKTFKFGAKDKAEIVRELKERIYSNLHGNCWNELADEFTEQIMEILRNEPSIQPALVAQRIIEASTKSLAKE